MQNMPHSSSLAKDDRAWKNTHYHICTFSELAVLLELYGLNNLNDLFRMMKILMMFTLKGIRREKQIFSFL